MSGRIAAVAAAAVLMLAVNPGVASAGGFANLRMAMLYYEPDAYWIMNDTSSPLADQSGFGRPLSSVGTGAAMTFHAGTQPATGDPGSLKFNPARVHSGQYVRTMPHPVSQKAGTIVIWFRLPKKLPAWTQVLAVDNGAWSGTGGGLMISKTGQLVSEDVSGFVDYRSKRQLNDGRWHCVDWVDTYNPVTGAPGATIYLDGARLTTTVTAAWTQLLNLDSSRMLLGDGGPREAKGIGRFTGNLSNVAIYEQTFGIDEVQGIWATGIRTF